MAEVIGEAVVRVRADTSDFDRTAKKDATNTGRAVGRNVADGAKSQRALARKAGTTLGSDIKQGIGLGIGAGAGAFIGKQLANAVTAGFREAKAAEVIDAQTQAVLKSTSSAAGITAEKVTQLGDALLKTAGYDDELVKSAANLLLTFTSVKGSVFEEGIRLAADLSKAFGIDLPAATILVGKALNDPVAGMTALSRLGVSFTEAQKAQIKTFADVGNAAAAQRVILNELTTEVGGSAAAYGRTFAGQVDIAKEKLGNLQGEIAVKLLPALVKLVDFAGNDLIPALESVSKFVGDNANVIAAAAVVIGGPIVLGSLASTAAAFLGIGAAASAAAAQASTAATSIEASAARGRKFPGGVKGLLGATAIGGTFLAVQAVGEALNNNGLTDAQKIQRAPKDIQKEFLRKARAGGQRVDPRTFEALAVDPTTRTGDFGQGNTFTSESAKAAAGIAASIAADRKVAADKAAAAAKKATDKATGVAAAAGAKANREMDSILSKRTTILDRFTTKIISLADKAKTAQNDVLSAKTRQADLVRTTAEGLASIADLSNSFGDAATNKAITPGQLTAFLTRQADQVARFGLQLIQLKQAGLNQAALDQIRGQGAQQGGQLASAILGGGLVGKFNDLQAQIAGSSTATAQALTAGTYQAEQAKAQSTLDGIREELAGLRSEQRQFAATGPSRQGNATAQALLRPGVRASRTAHAKPVAAKRPSTSKR